MKHKFNTIIIGLYIITPSITCDPQHFIFGNNNERGSFLDSHFYTQIIASIPIPCIDIILYDRQTTSYLLVLRNNLPEKNTWWVPGGRMLKGESFFQAAIRKCKDELDIDIKPEKILGVYSTAFPDSALGPPLHTINTIILAYFDGDQHINLNNESDIYKWESITSIHENSYIDEVRKDAIKHIS